MRHPQVLIVPGLALGLLLAACASTPQAPPEQPAVQAPAPEPQAPAAAVADPEVERDQARALRRTVERYSLAAYAQSSCQEAERQLEQGESLYGRDNGKSLAALQEAIRLYRLVLDTGFPQLATERQESARRSKADADQLKVAVALADAYREADGIYRQALSARESKDYARAVDLFAEAIPRFDSLTLQTKNKKARAEEALQDSQATLRRAEQQAEEALKARDTHPEEMEP